MICLHNMQKSYINPKKAVKCFVICLHNMQKSNINPEKVVKCFVICLHNMQKSYINPIYIYIYKRVVSIFKQVKVVYKYWCLYSYLSRTLILEDRLLD